MEKWGAESWRVLPHPVEWSLIKSGLGHTFGVFVQGSFWTSTTENKLFLIFRKWSLFFRPFRCQIMVYENTWSSETVLKSPHHSSIYIERTAQYGTDVPRGSYSVPADLCKARTFQRIYAKSWQEQAESPWEELKPEYWADMPIDTCSTTESMERRHCKHMSIALFTHL